MKFFVTRKEHEALEAYAKRLEDRIAHLENAPVLKAVIAQQSSKPALVRRFNWRRAMNEFEQRIAQEAVQDDSVTDA